MTVALEFEFGIISGYDAKQSQSHVARLFLRQVANTDFRYDIPLITNKSDLIASLDTEFEGVIPDHASPNHAALGYALGASLGVLQPETFDDATHTASEEIISEIGDPDHVVLLLLDGFGMNFVDTLPINSYVRKHTALTMCSTLPTSTGPNLIGPCNWPLAWNTWKPRMGRPYPSSR